MEVDQAAKEFWTEKYNDNDKKRRYFSYMVPKGMWQISFLGTRVCKNLKSFLRESIEGGKAVEYWITKRKRFNTTNFFRVDWEANKDAMESVSVTRRHWVTKFQSGICGTGRMMKIWKQRVIDNCPRCGSNNETTTHILQCPCKSAQEVWDQSLLTLEEWLKYKKTCPDLRRLLMLILDKWRKGVSVVDLVDYEWECCEGVFASQQAIGWRQLMGGCFSLEWAMAQDAYLKWLGVRKTGKRWLVELIKKMWEISWDVWQDRNETLHRTPMAADLSGAASLDKAIMVECQLGNEGLPQAVKDIFPKDMKKLLKAPLVQRKSWLVLVRASRELVHDDRVLDEFSDPRSHLRKWVGL